MATSASSRQASELRKVLAEMERNGTVGDVSSKSTKAAKPATSSVSQETMEALKGLSRKERKYVLSQIADSESEIEEDSAESAEKSSDDHEVDALTEKLKEADVKDPEMDLKTALIKAVLPLISSKRGSRANRVVKALTIEGGFQAVVTNSKNKDAAEKRTVILQVKTVLGDMFPDHRSKLTRTYIDNLSNVAKLAAAMDAHVVHLATTANIDEDLIYGVLDEKPKA